MLDGGRFLLALLLPEGIAILAPLANIAFDDIEIGMKLELVVKEFYRDESDKIVLTYAFRPQK